MNNNVSVCDYSHALRLSAWTSHALTVSGQEGIEKERDETQYSIVV